MKTIVWDVDDVLNDLMRAWFDDWASSRDSGSSLSYDQLTRNPPHELLGVSVSEYLGSLDDFRLSGKGGTMQPVAEVIEWLRRHGDRFHHVALTATPLCASHVSAEWVLRHFGQWIRSFNVIPSPRPGMEATRYHSTKSDFLRWWGKGDILVDDSEDNVARALSLGMRAVLIPQPWNRSALTREEALEELTELAS